MNPAQRTAHPLAIPGIILNILFPGVGSLLVGKIGSGIVQLILIVIGVLLDLTGIGMFFGIPLGIAMWVWALVISIQAFNQTSGPTTINISVTHPPQDPPSV